jgi:hypothetical protein
MTHRQMIMTIFSLALLPLFTACERNQDQMTPAAKQEQGNQKAQEYPSARNAENPDPSIGGTNSATSRKDAPVPATTPTPPTGTAGR